MSEKLDGNKEVSEQEIDDRLEELFDGKERFSIKHMIKFLALILFNLRKDFVELKKDYVEFKERVLDVALLEKGKKKGSTKKLKPIVKSMYL